MTDLSAGDRVEFAGDEWIVLRRSDDCLILGEGGGRFSSIAKIENVRLVAKATYTPVEEPEHPMVRALRIASKTAQNRLVAIGSQWVADDLEATVEAVINLVPKPEGKAMPPCACAPDCDGAAVSTEFSPYMDDYCHDCTTLRCDVSGAGMLHPRAEELVRDHAGPVGSSDPELAERMRELAESYESCSKIGVSLAPRTPQDLYRIVAETIRHTLDISGYGEDAS